MHKLTDEELSTLGVYKWTDIKDKFESSDILLGNGFSVKISDKLAYSSLFAKFISTLEDADKLIFEAFNTHNFEEILNTIENAREVNGIFEIGGIEQLEVAVDQLKTGLITAIKENHPLHNDLSNTVFQKISEELDFFCDIYTTNYDTFLYRVIMETFDRWNKDKNIAKYQDNFCLDGNHLIFDSNVGWRNHYKDVYYLHGALFIFQWNRHVYKVKRENSKIELLDLIKAKISEGKFPLFVSEGKIANKVRAITRSGYLSYCRQMLKECSESLVIYGSALADSHINSDIDTKEMTLAISVYCNTTAENVTEYMRKSKAAFTRVKDKNILFFDADDLF